MRRLEITTKVVAAVLALSAASKMIAVAQGERDVAVFWSLGITVTLLVFSIVWIKAVTARKRETIPLTVAFMCLPVVAAVAQIVSVWGDDEGVVFKVWVTLCLIGVTGIYLRFAMRWRRELREELSSVSRASNPAQ
jgi:Ca2+/Na+ antiporter